MSFGIKIKSVNITPSKILAKHGLGSDNKARKYLATSVAKYCDPYVPMSAGAGAHLKNQKQIAPDGSKVTYPGPYAHYGRSSAKELFRPSAQLPRRADAR